MHSIQKFDYVNESQVNMTAKIPREMSGRSQIQIELFPYPEFSESRNQVEARTLDYSHILTNIRSHICSKGYEYCPKEHFVELCEEQPDILSKAVVVNHTDAQNVFTSQIFWQSSGRIYAQQRTQCNSKLHMHC